MSEFRQPSGNRPEFSRPLRLARLRRDQEHEVEAVPDEAERAALAELLGLLGLRKMRLRGTLRPVDRAGWAFDGALGATVTQPCVATLKPVQTRIDVPVRRTWLPDIDEAALSEELEITADTPDELEPLGSGEIDLGELATGELALALPPYPRADDAPPPAEEAPQAGEETYRPFSALAALREKMEPGSGED